MARRASRATCFVGRRPGGPSQNAAGYRAARERVVVMMHMGGGARVGYGLMRSMRQDDKIKDHKLPKGIVKRIAGFAKPYRRSLALFLVLIVIDALVGAVNPLFTRAIINELIGRKDSTVVVELAVAVAVLAVFDAGLGLWERWISSRV